MEVKTTNFVSLIENSIKGKNIKFILSNKDPKKSFEGIVEKINYFDKNKGLLCLQVNINKVSTKKFVNIWFCKLIVKD